MSVSGGGRAREDRGRRAVAQERTGQVSRGGLRLFCRGIAVVGGARAQPAGKGPGALPEARGRGPLPPSARTQCAPGGTPFRLVPAALPRISLFPRQPSGPT